MSQIIKKCTKLSSRQFTKKKLSILHAVQWKFLIGSDLCLCRVHISYRTAIGKAHTTFPRKNYKNWSTLQLNTIEKNSKSIIEEKTNALQATQHTINK